MRRTMGAMSMSTASHYLSLRTTAAIAVVVALSCIACGETGQTPERLTAPSLDSSRVSGPSVATSQSTVAPVSDPADGSLPADVVDPPLVDPTGPKAETWAAQTINHVVNVAETAVIGTIVGLATHRDAGEGTTLSHIAVELDVERAIFGTVGDSVGYIQALPPTPDSAVDGLPAEVSPDQRFGPPLEIGDRVLVLLAKRTIGTADGATEALAPPSGYQSTWVLTEANAISIDPQRTVATDPLVERILEEHNAGRLTESSPADAVERDLGTTRNPLGDPASLTDVLPDLPPESGTIPTLVNDDPGTFTLYAADPFGALSARFGPSTSGGVIVGIYSGDELLSSHGAPTIGALEGLAVAAISSDGTHVTLAAFGEYDTHPAGIVVQTSPSVEVTVSAALWESEGRAAVVLVVPVGAAERITVDGLRIGTSVTFALPTDPAAYVPDR